MVRLGAMGDILHALPAVTALRQAHPGWIIDWVVEPAWTALLSARVDGCFGQRDVLQPLVDNIHTANAKRWGKRPLHPETHFQINNLRRALRAGNYDTALDFQGAVRSAWIAHLSGSRRRIGESSPREWAARWLFTERVVTHGAHVIEQDVELASAIAADELEPVPPLLPVDPVAESWCDSLLAPCGAQPTVLLNPGAGWGAKRWPVDRYAAVASALSARGYCVLVNAGPGETSLARSIEEQSGGKAISVSCSLAELIALTRRIRLLIAGDTGPLHLACALGRPVVGIYGPTDPTRNGPFGTHFRVLRSPESRRDHTRRAEPEAGLLTITPEAVLLAAEELLNEKIVI